MRISSRAHYGLRMMTELAKSFGGPPLSLTEIARRENMPLAYLEQLVAPLRPCRSRGRYQRPARGLPTGSSARRRDGS